MSSKKNWSIPGLTEWLAVVRAYQTCDKVMNRRLGEVGLTVPQYDLLMSLMKENGQTQQELAGRLLVVKSNVSSLLSRAERDGLIQRKGDPNDGRGKIVTLTPTGSRLARRGWEVQKQVVGTMFAAVPEAEVRRVARSIDKIREALLPLLEDDIH